MIHDRRGFVGPGAAGRPGIDAFGEDGLGGNPGNRLGSQTTPYRFKLAMWIDELRDRDELTLEQELEVAREIGIEHVWFQSVPGVTPIPEMSDAEVDRVGERLARYGRKLFMLSAWIPFHNLPLLDLDVKTMTRNSDFLKEFKAVVRSMQIAARLGAPAVLSYSFVWPGERGYGGPTWPMRWATRGGIIAEMDMEKLVKAFSLMLEQAEKYDVDLVLGMRPFNYVSSTGNFRRLAERLGSGRLKVQWSPADALLSAEWDQASAGFLNLRPYLHSIHMKDVQVLDGPRAQFGWRSLGDGQADYVRILRNLREHRSDAIPGPGHPLQTAQRIADRGHAHQLRQDEGADRKGGEKHRRVVAAGRGGRASPDGGDPAWGQLP